MVQHKGTWMVGSTRSVAEAVDDGNARLAGLRASAAAETFASELDAWQGRLAAVAAVAKLLTEVRALTAAFATPKNT